MDVLRRHHRRRHVLAIDGMTVERATQYFDDSVSLTKCPASGRTSLVPSPPSGEAAAGALRRAAEAAILFL